MDKNFGFAPAVAALFLLSIMGLASVTYAGDMQFFQGSIDYWGKDSKPNVETDPPKTAKSDEASATTNKPKREDTANTNPQEKGNFEWNKYMDPNNKEFFREGDYTPPEPFMELVRNPTDDNIRMWFAYMDRKNELASRLSKRMEEYAASNSAAIPKEAKEKIVKVAKNIPTPADDFERFRFRMYFDSQCPHCRHMFETLNDLQDRGYFVEARQVDKGPLDQIKSHVAIVPATSAELAQYNVTAVPLLLVGDLKQKKVYRQSGFMTPEQILAQVHEH